MTSQSRPQSQLPQPSSLRPRGSTRSSPALRSSRFAFQPSSPPSVSPPPQSISPVPEQRLIHGDSVNGSGLVRVASQPRKLKKSPSRSEGKGIAERRGNLGDRASQYDDEGVSSKIGDSRLGAMKNWGLTSKQETDSGRTRTVSGTYKVTESTLSRARVISAAHPIAIANSSLPAAVSNAKGDLAVPDTKADRRVTATFSSSSSIPRTSLLPPPRVRAVTLSGPTAVASKNATSIPIKSANIPPPKSTPAQARRSTAPTPKVISRSMSTVSTLKSRSAPSSPPPPFSTVTPIPALPPKSPLGAIPSSSPVASSSISTTGQTRIRPVSQSVSKSPSTSNPVVRKPSTDQPLPRSRYSSTPGPGPKARPPSLVLSPSSKLKPLLLSSHATSTRVTQTNLNRKRDMGTLGGGKSTMNGSPEKKQPATQDTFHGVAMNTEMMPSIPNPDQERQLKNMASLASSQPPLSRKPSIVEPRQRISSRTSTAVAATTPMTTMQSSIRSTSAVAASLSSSPKSSTWVARKPSLVATRTSMARTASSSSTPSTSASTPAPSSPTSLPASLSRKSGDVMRSSVLPPEGVELSPLKSPHSPNSGTTATSSPNTATSPSRSVVTSSVKGPREPKVRSRRGITPELKSAIDHTPTSPSHRDPSSPSVSLRKPHDASLLATESPEIPPSSWVPLPPNKATSNSFSSIISAYTSLPSSSPTTPTFRESSYSSGSSAQPPPSILSASSSSDTPSPHSTYAAPAPSSIFGMPLSTGTDSSNRERGRPRKPIPSFGSSTMDMVTPARGDDGDDWEAWRTSSESSGSSRTFRTAKQNIDKDCRSSNGDPGGSSATVLSTAPNQENSSSSFSSSSLAATKPSMFLLPELSLGGSLLSDELSLRAISVDIGECQAGSDYPSPPEEDPAPSDEPQTVAVIQENSPEKAADVVTGLDEGRQTAESRRRVSSSPAFYIRFPSEERRSETRSPQLQPFTHHSSRSLSPQRPPSGCRPSTPQKLPYNDMKQLLSKPSSTHTNPKVPSSSSPSVYSPFRSLRPISMTGSSHSNDPDTRTHSPSFALSLDESDASDTLATPAEEIMLAYKRQTQRHLEIERSIKEAERMVREMEREAEIEAEERLKLKVLRNAELDRGKQEMNMRRGDSRFRLQVEAKSTSATQSPLPTPPADFVSVSLNDEKAGASAQEPSPPSTPYYTVLGSSGTVVAVGDPKDSDLQLSWSPSFKPGLGTGLGLANGKESAEVWERTSTVTVGKPSRKKSRSRKTSTKPSDDIATSTTTASTESYELDIRVRGASEDRPHPNKWGLARSPPLTDDYSHTALAAIQPEMPPRESRLGASLPTPSSASTLSPTSPGYGGSRSRIWSIVKRISTGALRDKYSRSSEGPSSPTRSRPVFALPEQGAKRMKIPDASTPPDLTSSTSPGSTSVDLHQEPPRNGRNRRSSGIDRSETATGVRAMGTQNSPTATTRNSSSVKPSTATRSSSPVSSSDVTSSQFSAVPPSSRSSASSYKDELPPLPPSKMKSPSSPHVPPLQKHILSPSELSKLQTSIENEQDALAQSRKQVSSRPSLSTTTTGPSSTTLDSSSKSNNTRSIDSSRGYGLKPISDDWMIIPTPADERPPFSLPIPPSKSRRKEKEYRTAHSEDLRSPSSPDFPIAFSKPRESGNRSGSPTFPKFSITSPVNSWSKKANATSWKSPSMLKLPARPSTAPTSPSPSLKLFSRAPSPIAESVPSVGPSSPTTPKKAKDDCCLVPGRKSASSIPTLGGRSMFRELPDSQTKRTTLTEQEKADKWDALLEKSAAAGGTLHIRPGAHLLESDNLRFSIAESELDF